MNKKEIKKFLKAVQPGLEREYVRHCLLSVTPCSVDYILHCTCDLPHLPCPSVCLPISQYKAKAKEVLAHFDSTQQGLTLYGFLDALVSATSYGFHPGEPEAHA